jgi:spore maturation protein CgeB
MGAATAFTPALIPPRDIQPGRSILVLQNPGRGSRNYLNGIISALSRLGIRHCVLELDQVWTAKQGNLADLVAKMSRIFVQQKVGATLAYGYNGMPDMPLDSGPASNITGPFLRSFWEVRNIPQLMLWLDHPQWHSERGGLRVDLQGLFRSGNQFHFMKSAAHALEVERMMGWPNCFELPAAIDPAQFTPVKDVAPDYDIVAIMSEKAVIPPWMRKFIAEDAPDARAIDELIAADVRDELRALWRREANESMRAELTALGERWVALKMQQPEKAAFRHWPRLVDEFPGAAWYLTLAYPIYMNAARILWRFREWQRRFYAGYLARFFNVGIWGGDWSELSLGPGGWVDFLDQSKIYARGKLALNIVDGHDEEGLTLKPFEIAGSGAAMLHLDCVGIADAYEPNREVALFRTPAEARQIAGELLGDDARRAAMASAAYQRTLRDHTWDKRVLAMMAAARLPLVAFKA